MSQLLFDSIKISSYIVLIVNLILTLALTVLFYASIKTKNPFSAKTNALNILDLLLKIFLPFFLSKDTLQTGEKAVLIVIISLYCVLRDNILLGILPYYRLNALRIAGIAHAVTSSLVLASLFAKLFCKAHDDWNQYSVTALLYAVFGPSFIKVYTEYIRNKLLRIVLHPEGIQKACHVLQYWEVFKFFLKFGNTGLADSRISHEYFNFTRIIGFTQGNENSREALNSQKKAFFEKNMELLKSFTTIHPKNSWLVELAIARLYTKQESSCVLASHIINKHSNKNFFDKISLDLVKIKILNKLQSRLNKNVSEEQGQIASFIHMQNQYKKLRKSMIQSVDYHLKFWKMFASHKPSFLRMINFAKQNIISTKKLKSISNQSKDFRKSLFPEPLLACSLYCYFFQDDALLAGNLLKEYFLTEKRLKDVFDKSKASSQGLKFSSEAVYLIVSAEQNKLGEILDCSGHVGSAFGCPKEFLIGRPINVLIPPFYAKYHDHFLKAIQKESPVLDKTRPVPVLVEGGFLKPGLIHVSLTYMQDYELCYYVVIEAIKDDDTRLVLINTNGTISSCSENFAVDLGFNEYKDKDQLNIELLCPNFFHDISSQVNPHVTSDDSLASPAREILETKEIQQLSFFPFWHAKDKEVLSRLNPMVYQATLRKLKVQNSEIYELKMQKISTFNFTLPSQYTFPRTIKEILQSSRMDHQTEVPLSPLSPKSSDRPIALLSSKRKFFSTLRTYEVPISPTSSMTQQQLLTSSKGATEKHFEFNTNTTMLRIGTAESPMLKPAFTQINGDEDSFSQIEEEIISVQENTSTDKKQQAHHCDPLEDLDNKDIQMRENIIQDLFKASSTNTDFGKLESTKSIERQKIVKRLVQARTRRTETKFYICSFAVVCLLLLTLLIWLNFYTANTSQDVRLYSDVLQNSYFRSYWATIANQDTLYWLGRVIEWVDWDIDELYEAFNPVSAERIF